MAGFHAPELTAAPLATETSAPGRYAASEPGHLFMLQGIERGVLRVLAGQGMLPLRDKHILEIGCGSGYWLRALVQWGADPGRVVGVDLVADGLRAARRAAAPGTRLARGDGAALPFPDAWFDIVSQYTVFTSLLDPALKRRVAREALRVLKPDGLVLWYDFHVGNPRNHAVQPVGRREVGALFPGCAIVLRRVTLAPPLARLLARHAWPLCSLLERIPFLRTHYVGAIRRR